MDFVKTKTKNDLLSPSSPKAKEQLLEASASKIMMDFISVDKFSFQTEVKTLSLPDPVL